jgi:hypothetical protein
MGRRLAVQLSGNASHAPINIERCECTRAKYRIGESLRVLYQLQIQGTQHLVTARTFRNGDGERAYHRATGKAIPCGPLRPMVHDAEIDTVFWTFPNDRKIAHLSVLTGYPDALAQYFGDHCKEIRAVAYAPERAFTAQCLDAAGDVLAYAKVYAGDEGEQSYAIHEALWRQLEGSPNLRVPRAIAYLETYKTLLLEPIRGHHAADLDGFPLEEATRGFGAALATLHAQRPPTVPRFYHLDLSALTQASHLLAQIRPDVGRTAETLVGELHRRFEPSRAPEVCLHGDVNFKNWIATSEGVALVDLDAVSTGPAAADLGGVLSGLRYRYHIGRYSVTLERQLSDAFLDGYAMVSVLPPVSELRWHTAAALLAQRAFRAVTRVRPEALPHIEALLTDAQRILRGHGDD